MRTLGRHILQLLSVLLCGYVTAEVSAAYVKGATIFLDTNYNGLRELNEPSAISGLTGSYMDDLASSGTQCIGFAPIIVDIPPNTKGNANQTGQRLTISPSAQTKNTGTQLTVDSLTALIWQVISNQEAEASEIQSCEQAQARAQIAAATKSVIRDAIYDAIRHENISEPYMLQVLQAPQTSDQLQQGRKLLKGLVKSIEQTLLLLQQEPNAEWARVEYHQFDDRDADQRFPLAWYRVLNKRVAGLQEFHLQRVSDDLTQPLHTIIYGKTSQSTRNNLSIRESVEVESRQGNFEQYQCDIKETISGSRQQTDYSLVNLAGGQAGSFEGCTINRPFNGRYVFVDYSENQTRYATQFYFSAEQAFAFLPDWKHVQQNQVEISLDTLIEQASQLPYRFDDQAPTSATWWVKSQEYDDDGVQVRLQRNQNNEWTKTLTQPDGTSTKQCSGNGKTWRPC